MLISSSKAAHEVKSEADPFFSLIDQRDQRLRFSKNGQCQICLVTIIEKYGGQIDAGFWPDFVLVHPSICTRGYGRS